MTAEPSKCGFLRAVAHDHLCVRTGPAAAHRGAGRGSPALCLQLSTQPISADSLVYRGSACKQDVSKGRAGSAMRRMNVVRYFSDVPHSINNLLLYGILPDQREIVTTLGSSVA